MKALDHDGTTGVQPTKDAAQGKHDSCLEVCIEKAS